MAILTFLLELFGAVFLLLFAVRMVRTGIERAYGAMFRRLVTAGGGALRLAPVGALLAIVLQSSAAVTLLVAGFAANGALAFAPAMALVLGGDLGAALVISVLSLPLDRVLPVLLVAGGFLFLKTDGNRLRQAGRILLGIAFILISLRFLRETVEPLSDSNLLPALAAWFERDFITAFLAGAALAFVMHSSIAVILMCVAIVSIGALPPVAGASLVLGANLGSALIPLWLGRDLPAAARRICWANLFLRGIGAVLAVCAVNLLPAPPQVAGLAPGYALVLLHILFNAALLVFLPAMGLLDPVMQRFIPSGGNAHVPLHHRSVLSDKALATPHQALATLRREVLRMAGVLAEMLTPVMAQYQDFDPARATQIRSLDIVVNRALDGIRQFAARAPRDEMNRAEQREMRALVDYAIALEAAGDIVVKRLIPLAEEKARDGLSFSTKGAEELTRIHAQVEANLASATNVLVSSDLDGARSLIEEKARMSKLERASRKQHLKRLTAGKSESFGSSDIHLETAYSLKELNSWIVTVAHPILAREGELLDSRLRRDDPDEG